MPGRPVMRLWIIARASDPSSYQRGALAGHASAGRVLQPHQHRRAATHAVPDGVRDVLPAQHDGRPGRVNELGWLELGDLISDVVDFGSGLILDREL